MIEKLIYIAFFGSAFLGWALVGFFLYKLLPFWLFVFAMMVVTLGSLIAIACVFVSGYNSRREEAMYGSSDEALVCLDQLKQRRC